MLFPPIYKEYVDNLKQQKTEYVFWQGDKPDPTALRDQVSCLLRPGVPRRQPGNLSAILRTISVLFYDV